MPDVQTLAIANVDVKARKSIHRALGHLYHLTPISGPTATAELDSVDLVIYDLSSGGDSRHVIGEVKALRRSKPNLPVLVLASEKSAENLVSKMLELGVIDFMRKPLNEHELHLRVSHCLRRLPRLRRSRAELAPETGVLVPSLEEEADVRSRFSPLTVPLQELHGSSGRLDASKMATYLAVPLTSLAGALGVGYTSLHKTPDSVPIQPQLSKIKRVLVILSGMLGKREVVLAWLNSTHPDIGGRTPLTVILEGHADAVVTVLENAIAGIAS